MDFEEQVIIDMSIPNCVKDIINSISQDDVFLDLGDMPQIVLEELNLAGLAMSTFNHSDDYNLTFKMGNLGGVKNAETSPRPDALNPGKFIITITLDQSFISNATDLVIARTIIHESLHAYLTWVTQEDFLGTLALRILTISSNLGLDSNGAQHTEMSNNFVNAISNSLKSWHQSTLSDDNYYDYLSWSGSMLSTQALMEKSSTFQSNVIAAHLAEGQAGSGNASTANAQGTNSTNCC